MEVCPTVRRVGGSRDLDPKAISPVSGAVAHGGWRSTNLEASNNYSLDLMGGVGSLRPTCREYLLSL